MKWKHRYVWYCLIFGMIIAFGILPFGIFPLNFLGYIPLGIAIIYDIYRTMK